MSQDKPTPAPGCPNCAALAKRVDDLEKRVEELLARLNQNSSNSHMPPSSDPPSAPQPPAKRPSGRRPGGQPGHPPHLRQRLPADRVNEFVHYRPTECVHCHARLPGKDSRNDPPTYWHQVFELPEIAVIVTEHLSHARICPCCQKSTRTSIPPEVSAYGFGPRLAGMMSYLSGRCHDGRRVVEEIVEDLLGVPIALGTVSNYEEQMSQALQPAHEQAMTQVRNARAKNVDETGWKRAGKNCWLWGAATATVAAFGIFVGRNVNALHALLGRIKSAKVDQTEITIEIHGIVTSDRLPAYHQIPVEYRQICWSHLQRDFQALAERCAQTKMLGEDGLKICEKLFARWRDFRQRKINRKSLQRKINRLRKRMGQILRWGLRCGDKKASEFCRRLIKLEQAMWTFARVPGVEPTNNHAERILRMGVLWRKNSFGCHSERGCRFVERMLTVIQTLRLQKRKVLEFLQETIKAHRENRPLPALG